MRGILRRQASPWGSWRKLKWCCLHSSQAHGKSRRSFEEFHGLCFANLCNAYGIGLWTNYTISKCCQSFWHTLVDYFTCKHDAEAKRKVWIGARCIGMILASRGYVLSAVNSLSRRGRCKRDIIDQISGKSSRKELVNFEWKCVRASERKNAQPLSSTHSMK